MTRRLYLEFAWHRSGTYLRKLDRVDASIRWFVGEARSRSGDVGHPQ
jgi:hypothetical protein